MITKTEAIDTRPHQDLSQAGYPRRVRMMPLGQTLKVPKGGRVWIQVTIGCWNVRTIYQTGKLGQLAQELRRYKVRVVWISECR